MSESSGQSATSGASASGASASGASASGASASGASASGAATLLRSVPQYDPTRTYEVVGRDIEYRHDGATSWVAHILQPQGTGPFPAVLEVHGGAWNNGDRFQNLPLNQAVAATGIVVASIEFRLGADGRYPASIADVNYGTRWLKQHAAEFNATADALGVIGYSSGGHMAMLSAMKPADPRYAALPLPGGETLDASVAYIIMGWPVLDPLARYHHAKRNGRAEMLENHHRYWGDEAAMADGNPQLILERGEAVQLPPALLVQGADDDVLSPNTAERFASAYGKAGGVIEVALYPQAGHGYARDGGPNTDRTLDLMASFITRQLRAISRG